MRKCSVLAVVVILLLMVGQNVFAAESSSVPPKQVQIKFGFYEIRSEFTLSTEKMTALKSGIDGVNIFQTNPSDADIKKIREQLSKANVIINSPIIAAIDGSKAKVSVNTVIPYKVNITDSEGKTEILDQKLDLSTEAEVLPKINGDGTVDLSTSIKAPKSFGCNLEIKADFQLESGNSGLIVVYNDKIKVCGLIILTPTIID